jgi:phosphatidylinositol glycan class C protein
VDLVSAQAGLLNQPLLLLVCLAPAGVYLMSPMLHSLTRNISEDSVIAMIVGLCVLHLFLHDYK